MWSHRGGPCAADYALGLRPRPNTPGYPSGPEDLRTPALVRGALVAPAGLLRGPIAVMLPTTTIDPLPSFTTLFYNFSKCSIRKYRILLSKPSPKERALGGGSSRCVTWKN